MSRAPSRSTAARGVALLAALSAVLLSGACAGKGDVVVPTASAGQVATLSSAQGKALINSDRKVLVIDVRPVEAYRSGHLVGAQSIDATDADTWKFRTTALDKDRPTVVYCGDAACSASAAQMLIDAGFTEVYDMGGIKGWDQKVLELEKPESHQPIDGTAQ